VDSIQVIYNIFEQRPAEQLLPAAIEGETGIIVRVPFEEGLLTGRLTPDYRFPENDWRAEWLTPERRAEAAPRVEALKRYLAPDRPTLPALALKFILANPAVSTVIPGMRRPAHVDANVAVSDGIPLDAATLEALKSHAFVHGWMYPWLA
jgi:aryl-alcohol dehydrogenase-like predicted oxidoreductase